MKPSPVTPSPQAARTPDWRCRHGAAVLCADAIRTLAEDTADALVHLSLCEGEPEELQRLLGTLRAQLVEAERLCECFDCADRHAAEEPDA